MTIEFKDNSATASMQKKTGHVDSLQTVMWNLWWYCDVIEKYSNGFQIYFYYYLFCLFDTKK